ncbi:hypothetical protein BCV70DRAFT_200806 [Testicularia cyperi]|uniref:COQ9 domain-containing protein n=1 Tax=Testicularia cyperi TaxID=1882483 RepID=A0A317XRC1_9BASI|nr:hypothetical protein BCV70DRAFT_200806 [Testicularia cyperi]
MSTTTTTTTTTIAIKSARLLARGLGTRCPAAAAAAVAARPSHAHTHAHARSRLRFSTSCLVAQHPFGSSSSSSKPFPSTTTTTTTKNQKYSSDTHALPIRTQILLQSLPHVDTHGFTKHAYLSTDGKCVTGATFPSLDPSHSNLTQAQKSRLLTTLFSSSTRAFDAALFHMWAQTSDVQVSHRLASPAEAAGVLIRGGSSPAPSTLAFQAAAGGGAGGGAAGRRVDMRASLSSNQEREALQKLSTLVEERLGISWRIRRHLVQGISAYCTLDPSSFSMLSALAHRSMLPAALPDAAQLLGFSSRFVDALLTSPQAQQQTGWLEPDGPGWYTIRTRLAAAYLLATLHMASGHTTHFQDTQLYFRRILADRETGVLATLSNAIHSAGQWSTWGARGWLGIFRSLGL